MAMHRMVNGEKVELTPEEEAELLVEWEANKKAQEARAWLEGRVRSYPKIEEQLDMLFHDALNGTTTWQDTISDIKARYPKPKS